MNIRLSRLHSFCLMLAAGTALAQTPSSSSKVIAVFDGKPLTEADLRKDIPMEIFQAESDFYDVKKGWIEKQVRNTLFDQAAKESRLSRKDWEKRELDDKIKPPTSEDVQAFIKQHMPPSEAGKTEAVGQAAGYLTRKKRGDLETKLYQDLLKKHHLDIQLAKPVAPH